MTSLCQLHEPGECGRALLLERSSHHGVVFWMQAPWAVGRYAGVVCSLEGRKPLRGILHIGAAGTAKS